MISDYWYLSLFRQVIYFCSFPFHANLYISILILISTCTHYLSGGTFQIMPMFQQTHPSGIIALILLYQNHPLERQIWSIMTMPFLVFQWILNDNFPLLSGESEILPRHSRALHYLARASSHSSFALSTASEWVRDSQIHSALPGIYVFE